MKIRVGFISNSSSSSFILGKAYLNEEQINKIIYFIKERTYPRMNMFDEEYMDNEDYYFREDTNIDNNEYYFYGCINYCDANKIDILLKELNVDFKYVLSY